MRHGASLNLVDGLSVVDHQQFLRPGVLVMLELMYYGAILDKIDLELDRLTKARSILAGLLEPAVPTRSRLQRRLIAVESEPPVAMPMPGPVLPEAPRLTLIPPVKRREVQRRVKPPAPVEPRALGGNVPSAPVVVAPRVLPPTILHSATEGIATPEDLERVMRENLLASAARPVIGSEVPAMELQLR